MIGNRQRSGHHHRQFSSDNFLVDPPASNKLPQNSSQMEYSRMLRSMQKGMGGEFLMDPSTPAGMNNRQNSDVSPNELSPGLLDLHSFDTELLPEMLLPSLYDGVGGKSFDDSDPSFGGNKLMGKSSASLDKDKGNSAAKIKVVVRKRPLNKKEASKREEDIISIEHSNALTVHETKLKVDLTEYVEKHEFVFDAVLDEDVSNDVVYHETVEQIVPAIFQKVKATCFAYGQTGSGKTYTMQPLPLKASQDILRLLHHAYRNQGFQLFVSFFEIYGGKLYDLLNDRSKLCMREDGKQQVCIVGLQEYRVSDVDSIKELIDRGNATRSIGTTGANEESSRSHAILQLAIKRSADGSDTKPARVVGKLSFIDLAGSERGADTTDNDKQTRIEGAEINKSLLALKECIRALDNSQVHIPFRGSKLTEVLRDSFIGNSRTVMISCISPNAGSCEHTLNTLRYADRVKSLSKGNGIKKEMSATNLNLRESTSVSLSSNLHAVSTIENNKKYENTATGSNRFGWNKHAEKEISPPFNLDRVPSGREVNIASTRANSYREQSREEVNFASSRTQFYREQSTSSFNAEEGDFDEEYEHGQRFLRDRKVESYSFSRFDGNEGRRAEAQPKSKNMNYDGNGFHPEEDFSALLMLEEDLVIAHRKQVEDTINIVREEMELLDEADQPGNQLDDYISRLNNILSQKAAGIVNLQSRLAHFQRRLTEHNVLASNMAP